tara:strand:- start:2556 stop:2855 length:300 start_codon:yes stop_codon:yes gene_type:complete
MMKTFAKIRCADGFTMSVQAGSGGYSSPRMGEGPFTAVEVGFPSAREEMLMEYIDGDPETTEPTGTVYGWVPAEVILKVVTKHGGQIAGEMPWLQLGGE